jgi:cell division protein FtsA
MGKRSDNIITVIDVGSAKTVALAAEVTESGLKYHAHGIAESKGTRKGVIVDLDKAVGAVQKAMEDAEAIASFPLENATVGISGAHIRSVNSQGGITLGARPREAVDKARSIPLPGRSPGRAPAAAGLHLDEQDGLRDPAGMMGASTRGSCARDHRRQTAPQNVITVMNRAGIHVDDTVFEPLACSDAVLRSDERELGVCICRYRRRIVRHDRLSRGAVPHTAVIPIGGDHFTNDVAVGLPRHWRRRKKSNASSAAPL